MTTDDEVKGTLLEDDIAELEDDEELTTDEDVEDTLLEEGCRESARLWKHCFRQGFAASKQLQTSQLLS